MTDVYDEYWRELLTTALLGTDRREPSAPPDGPIADVVADSLRDDRASRMLATVATVAAVRRAAFVPSPPAGPLLPPARDDRPLTPPLASGTWHAIVDEWPILEDEWVLAVIAAGHRLAPDLVIEMLLRHRRDPVRRARAVLAAGPVADWLTDQLPDLAPPDGRAVPVDAIGALPELPIPPDLAELLALDAHSFVRRLLPGFEQGRYGRADKAVLVNLLARCRPEVLVPTADALATVDSGLALVLADLARLRHRMLTELR